MSRVDKLENAVVSEILIQLTSTTPRNISAECASMICQDLATLGAALADDLNFDTVTGLNFMDALPMYRLVLSRFDSLEILMYKKSAALIFIDTNETLSGSKHTAVEQQC